MYVKSSNRRKIKSTIASISWIAFRVDSDRVRVIRVHFGILLLLNGTLGYSLECLFHINSLFGRCFKVRDVSFGLAPRHCSLLSHLTFVLLDVNLVAKDDEREVVGIMRAGLDEELVSPAVQHLKRLGIVHVIHEDAAIRPSVVGDAQ